MAVHLGRRRRIAEAERKRSYMEKYIPHLARGLREILGLDDRAEKTVVNRLAKMLERTRLDA
jgi:DNA topoisomerase VI subunit B